MRKIPSTMASQHPDHANVPYWHNQALINIQEESKELYLNFSELGIDEYKWDWEGKLVDESVLERILGEYYDYFSVNNLGKEKFLTFRLPNPKVENEFRVGRALMGIMSANSLSKQVGLHSPVLFEVILPMTESADEMLSIVEAYEELSSLKHPLYRFGNGEHRKLEIIPLFEQVDTIINSDQILKEYLKLFVKKFRERPTYLRPYVARSDPALNSGIVPTVLAIKIALSKFRNLEKELKVKLFPIIGAAALPFRGGISPDTVEDFINEYKGIKTTLIQSAFRYDYPKEKVIEGIKKLNELLPSSKAELISADEIIKLIELIKLFEPLYRDSIEKLAPLINKTALYLPKRRERVQHIGLFGYSRGVGKVKLPRAITFTGSLYSIGVPPELIGTGRGISLAKKKGLLPFLEKYYLNLKKDLWRAGQFLNKKNLLELSQKSKDWSDILKDVEAIEEYLGLEFEPTTQIEKEHSKLTDKILKQINLGISPTELIVEAAILRRSIG